MKTNPLTTNRGGHDVFHVWSESPSLPTIEMRSDAPGAWVYREVPLHEDIVILIFLDVFVTPLYETVASADWYHEGDDMSMTPLGFSSVKDFNAFVEWYPDVLSCADFVLHWLNGEASLENFLGFYLSLPNEL